MAEAAHLNRTLLLADKFCSSHFHNPNGDTVWHPFENVFNMSHLRKHVRIELLPDPSAFIETLTPGSSIVYLRNEILTEVRLCFGHGGGPCMHLPQRLDKMTDMDVLVRMHRPWKQDPLVRRLRILATCTSSTQGVMGYRPWYRLHECRVAHILMCPTGGTTALLTKT